MLGRDLLQVLDPLGLGGLNKQDVLYWYIAAHLDMKEGVSRGELKRKHPFGYVRAKSRALTSCKQQHTHLA